MRVRSGLTDDICWFEFKANTMSEVIRVEWPLEGLAILPKGVVKVLLAKGYATGLTDEDLTYYNAAVDAHNKAVSDHKVEPSSITPLPTGSDLGKDPGASNTNPTPEDKPSEAKAPQDKPSEAKPAEAKPAEAEPAEAKPAEAEPAEAKPAETKSESNSLSDNGLVDKKVTKAK